MEKAYVNVYFQVMVYIDISCIFPGNSSSMFMRVYQSFCLFVCNLAISKIDFMFSLNTANTVFLPQLCPYLKHTVGNVPCAQKKSAHKNWISSEVLMNSTFYLAEIPTSFYYLDLPFPQFFFISSYPPYLSLSLSSPLDPLSLPTILL